MHCDTKIFTLGSLIVEKNRIDVSPPYQRESGAWSVSKQQLFIDSLINKYDIPKLYFNDLRKSGGEFQYAVIDGKQRLHALWEFVGGRFPLPDEFVHLDESNGIAAKAGARYTEFSEQDKEVFKSRSLDVVVVQNADSEDIEELFARLNNGEPLNAAEKRNALGGHGAELIRSIAELAFFNKNLPFKNRRYNHYEIAAKFLRMEESLHDGGGIFVDLKKKHLDKFVTDNRVSTKKSEAIAKSVKAHLAQMRKMFDDEDRLLSKQSYPQLYYAFTRDLLANYGHESVIAKIKSFLVSFELARLQNYEKTEDERDPVLVEYSRKMQQGTNDASSMQERSKVLLRLFLSKNSDVTVLSGNRAFSDEERWALWIVSGRKCSKCGCEVRWEEFDADHTLRFADGGATLLSNGRALCVNCNRSGNAKKK